MALCSNMSLRTNTKVKHTATWTITTDSHHAATIARQRLSMNASSRSMIPHLEGNATTTSCTSSALSAEIPSSTLMHLQLPRPRREAKSLGKETETMTLGSLCLMDTLIVSRVMYDFVCRVAARAPSRVDPVLLGLGAVVRLGKRQLRH